MTRDEILQATDKEILAEVEKIKYLYRMKRVIRADQEREDSMPAESNAEHVYSMMVLVEYFLPLEDPERKLDRAKTFHMAMWHDLGEIETGDIISHLKTSADEAVEYAAQGRVVEQVPEVLQTVVESAMAEYENQETPESHFIKAIDKIDPMLEYFGEDAKKLIIEKLKLDKEDVTRLWGSKKKYIEPFPVIYKFYEVVLRHMLENNYYCD